MTVAIKFTAIFKFIAAAIAFSLLSHHLFNRLNRHIGSFTRCRRAAIRKRLSIHTQFKAKAKGQYHKDNYISTRLPQLLATALAVTTHCVFEALRLVIIGILFYLKLRLLWLVLELWWRLVAVHAGILSTLVSCWAVSGELGGWVLTLGMLGVTFALGVAAMVVGVRRTLAEVEAGNLVLPAPPWPFE